MTPLFFYIKFGDLYMPEENILNMPLNNHIYDCITTDQSYDFAKITIPEYTEDDFIRDMETI